MYDIRQILGLVNHLERELNSGATTTTKRKEVKKSEPHPHFGQFMIATLITVGFNGFDRPSSSSPSSAATPRANYQLLALYASHVYMPDLLEWEKFRRISTGSEKGRNGEKKILYSSDYCVLSFVHLLGLFILLERSEERGERREDYEYSFCLSFQLPSLELPFLWSVFFRVPGMGEGPSECAINCFWLNFGANFRKCSLVFVFRFRFGFFFLYFCLINVAL